MRLLTILCALCIMCLLSSCAAGKQQVKKPLKPGQINCAYCEGSYIIVQE